MADRRLRIALLSYRGAPHCGGQGVYVRNLSRELVAQGHHVEVLGGPPYPELDEGVELTRLASLDLYHESDPFRTPRPDEFRDGIDVLEYAAMCTAAFPEPLTFSLRAKREVARRRAEFDLVHDNQCLGWGLLGMQRLGLPVLATVHHPITVDRELELAAATSPWRRLTLRRWYAFTRMQARVARRLPRLVTVSEQSAGDVAAAFDVPRERLEVIHNGVDERKFRPREEVRRVPGRLVTTASADAPLKGLVPLLEALAKIRTRRDDVHLVVVGRRKEGGLADRAMQELSLPDDAVRFVHGIDDEELATLLASAEVAVVPSLYEGFSLPAIESMACGTPLVATTGGALPEVAGTDGDTALLVPPGEPGPLATAIERLLDDPQLRARLGDAGRLRVLERFTWRVAAARTTEQYRHVIASREEPAPVTAASRTPPC